MANTIGAEEIEIMTRERPEESVKKREEELPEAMSLTEKKNKDQRKHPHCSTPTPSPQKGREKGRFLTLM